MAAAYGSHSGTTYASRTNTTLTAPSGITDGDELILYFLLAAADVSSIVTPTFPAGFSTIAGPTTVSQDNAINQFSVRSWMLRKRASSESGSYTITHTAATSDGFLVRVTGGANATPTATANDGDGTGNITFLGITTSAAGSCFVACCHNWNLWGAGTAPAGTTPTFTERQDSATAIIYAATGEWSGSGASGDKTKDSDNISAPDQWAAMMVAIEAAVGGGTDLSAGLREGSYARSTF